MNNDPHKVEVHEESIPVDTDTDTEVVTSPAPIKKRPNIPVPVLAGVTAALLGGVVMFAMQKPKPAETVITPSPTPPVTAPVTTPSATVNAQKLESKTTTSKTSDKESAAAPKPSDAKTDEAKPLTQEEIRQKKKAIEGAKTPEPKVKDPFVSQKDAAVASIPEAPTVIKTTTSNVTTATAPQPTTPAPAVQSSRDTLPSVRAAQTQPTATAQAPQSRVVPLTTVTNSRQASPPQNPIIVETLPASRQASSTSPTIIRAQPIPEQLPQVRAPQVTITTPKAAPPVIINSTPAPPVVIQPTPTAPKVKPPVAVTSIPKPSVVIQPTPTAPKVKPPVAPKDRETVIVAQPAPQTQTEAKKTPATTAPPATPGTVAPLPTAGTPEPTVKLNAAEQWVKDNNIKYGGSASTDGKTAAMLSSSQGDIFVNVGETIPATKTTVVKADEKSVTLKVENETTQLELP